MRQFIRYELRRKIDGWVWRLLSGGKCSFCAVRKMVRDQG